MNTFMWKDNLYKNGEWHPCHSKAMAVEKAKNIVPTKDAVEYRDDLYKFCDEKGLIGNSFPLGRTRKAITANIRAFITILNKHGLADEFFKKEKENDNG